MLLPFLGKVSLDLITSLKNSICKNLLFCEIEIIFKSSRRISKYFEFKKICPIACALTSYYKFSCSRYNANYYDKTCWYLSVRVGEHSGVSLLTGKKSKSKKSTAVKDHMFFLILLYPLTTLKFWQPATQISMLRSEKVFWYHAINPSDTKIKRQ